MEFKMAPLLIYLYQNMGPVVLTRRAQKLSTLMLMSRMPLIFYPKTT